MRGLHEASDTCVRNCGRHCFSLQRIPGRQGAARRSAAPNGHTTTEATRDWIRRLLAATVGGVRRGAVSRSWRGVVRVLVPTADPCGVVLVDLVYEQPAQLLARSGIRCAPDPAADHLAARVNTYDPSCQAVVAVIFEDGSELPAIATLRFRGD